MDELSEIFNKLTIEKGANCSINGKKYEEEIYKIVSKCIIKEKNTKFNNQKKEDLGGCKKKHDIVCLYDGKQVPIEIKKKNTPDWMQCSIKNIENKYVLSEKAKISTEAKKIFEKNLNTYLEKNTLFNNSILKLDKVKYNELKKMKEENKLDDVYFECDNTTIRDLYGKSGCYYIQISDKGLYHLGEDIFLMVIVFIMTKEHNVFIHIIFIKMVYVLKKKDIFKVFILVEEILKIGINIINSVQVIILTRNILNIILFLQN